MSLNHLFLDLLLVQESLLVRDEGGDISEVVVVLVVVSLGCIVLLHFAGLARVECLVLLQIVSLLGDQFWRKTALQHLFLLLLEKRLLYLLLLSLLHVEDVFLALLGVYLRFVTRVVFVDYHIFLRNQEVGAFFMVELFHEFVVCRVKVLRAFHFILGHFEAAASSFILVRSVVLLVRVLSLCLGLKLLSAHVVFVILRGILDKIVLLLFGQPLGVHARAGLLHADRREDGAVALLRLLVVLPILIDVILWIVELAGVGRRRLPAGE